MPKKLTLGKVTQFYIQQSLTQFPLLFIIVTIILIIMTSSKELGKFLAVILCSKVFSALLKKIIKKVSNNATWARRPKGARNCSAVIMPGNPEPYTSGMPSGHAMEAAVMATYGILMLWLYKELEDDPIKFGNYNDSEKGGITAFIVFLSLLIALHRTNIPYLGVNCHTRLQVVIGFMIGIGVGTAGYFIAHL